MYFIMKNKKLITYILITIIIILLVIIIFLIENQKLGKNKYIENTSNTTYDTSNEIINSKSNNATENKNIVQNEIYENNNTNISVNDKKIKNVQIKIEEDTISPSGVSIIIIDNNNEPYTWGENYTVQKKVKNEWKTLNANMNINSNAYVLDKNNQLRQNINWINVYGNLPKGTYRIEKEADGDKFYSNEFVIE